MGCTRSYYGTQEGTESPGHLGSGNGTRGGRRDTGRVETTNTVNGAVSVTQTLDRSARDEIPGPGTTKRGSNERSVGVTAGEPTESSSKGLMGRIFSKG